MENKKIFFGGEGAQGGQGGADLSSAFTPFERTAPGHVPLVKMILLWREKSAEETASALDNKSAPSANITRYGGLPAVP
ncbi:MAG: hypothetical protein J5855_11180 [Mailhella sp.]|nr:hypothetical protein [Mailhella sp.]